jgi:hypothetical protein
MSEHPFQRVEHVASGRQGWRVATQRRFRTEGVWVVWDEHSTGRPTWHPLGVLRAPQSAS